MVTLLAHRGRRKRQKSKIRIIGEANGVLLEGHIVISDTHFLFDRDIKNYEASYHVLSSIKRLKKYANKLIIAGDFKDPIFKIFEKEKQILRDFIEDLLTVFSDIRIIKGNHDGKLEKIIDADFVVRDRSLKIKDVIIAHGHAWPNFIAEDTRFIILGHSHPVFIFKEYPNQPRLPVFVRYSIKDEFKERIGGKPEVIVLPAFNEYLGGQDVRETLLDVFYMYGYVDKESIKVYTTTGIRLL